MDALKSWAYLFFGWPNGGVWSNILASLLCGLVAWLWARGHLRRLHARHGELHRLVAELHARASAAEPSDHQATD